MEAGELGGRICKGDPKVVVTDDHISFMPA